ncbi:MAG: hypothetical protein ACRYFV_05805 [Janthinobacterium lividum]
MPSSQTPGQGQARAKKTKCAKQQNTSISRKARLATAFAFLLSAIATAADYSPYIKERISALYTGVYKCAERVVAAILSGSDVKTPPPPAVSPIVRVIYTTAPQVVRIVYRDSSNPSPLPPPPGIVTPIRAYTFVDVNSMDRAISSVRDSIQHPLNDTLGTVEKQAERLVLMARYYHDPQNYEAQYKLLKLAFELYVYVLHRPKQDAYARLSESKVVFN